MSVFHCNRNCFGIYVHVPFCVKKCNYCNFFSCTNLNLIDDYVDSLCCEIVNSNFANLKVDSLYFGGGTPNLLKIEQLEKILNAINSKFQLTKDLELSMEFNPGLGNIFYLKNLRKLGFNRLSVGVQSTDDGLLKFLGRLHLFAQVQETFKNACKAGFENISADYLIGIKGQNFNSVKAGLNKLINLNVKHISIYQLKIEPCTVFSTYSANMWLTGDEVARIYEQTVNFLKNNRFSQYEISNFSKIKFKCRHNLKYWLQKPYLGFGPSAHSFFNGRRFFCPSNLDFYLNNNFKKVAEQQVFSSSIEWLLLRLRLNHYVSFNELKQRGFKKAQLLNKLIDLEKNKLCKLKSIGFKLTAKGMLVQNSVLAFLFDF